MTSKIQPDQFLIADLPMTRVPGTSSGTATKKALVFYRMVIAATGDYLDLDDYMKGVNSIEGVMYYTIGDKAQPVSRVDGAGTAVEWNTSNTVCLFGTTGTARVGLVVEMK